MREYSAKAVKQPHEIRSDASTNRKALIISARKLFASNGPEVSLTQIAQKAGISRATLYRNFPDKASIIIEIINYNIDLLEAYAKRLNGSDNRFFKLLEAIIRQQVKYQTMAMMIPTNQHAIAKRLLAVFKLPLEEAKKSGNIRSDFILEKDLLLLIMMMGGALLHIDDTDKTTRIKRALTFALEGIKKR